MWSSHVKRVIGRPVTIMDQGCQYSHNEIYGNSQVSNNERDQKIQDNKIYKKITVNTTSTKHSSICNVGMKNVSGVAKQFQKSFEDCHLEKY